MTLRILLADDHQLFRRALRMSLETLPGIEIVAEAETGSQAVVFAGQAGIDIVCMDINMPDLDGIEATQAILATHPEVKVIGMSAHADPIRVGDMFRAGAMGYVDKSSAGVELPDAIVKVGQGQIYLSAALGVLDMEELMLYGGPAKAGATLEGG